MQDNGEPDMSFGDDHNQDLAQRRFGIWNNRETYALHVAPSGSQDASETVICEKVDQSFPDSFETDHIFATDACTAIGNWGVEKPFDPEEIVQTAKSDIAQVAPTPAHSNACSAREYGTELYRTGAKAEGPTAIANGSLTACDQAAGNMACPFFQANPRRCQITKQNCEGQTKNGFKNWSRTREHVRRDHVIVKSPCPECDQESWVHCTYRDQSESNRIIKTEQTAQRKTLIKASKSRFSTVCTHPSHDYDPCDWIPHDKAQEIFAALDSSRKHNQKGQQTEGDKWFFFYRAVFPETPENEVPSHSFRPCRSSQQSLDQLLDIQATAFAHKICTLNETLQSMVMDAFAESQRALRQHATSSSIRVDTALPPSDETAAKVRTRVQVPEAMMQHPALSVPMAYNSTAFSSFSNTYALDLSWQNAPGALGPPVAMPFYAQSCGGLGVPLTSTGFSQTSSSGMTRPTSLPSQSYMEESVNGTEDMNHKYYS